MKVAVIALTAVAHDSRVLRTVRTLADSGHDVHLIGFGDAPRGGAAIFHSLGAAPSRFEHRALVLLGYAPARSIPAVARIADWLRPTYRRMRKTLNQIRPDVVHANDWPTLPVAIALKRATGARIVYDSHEFAREEHGTRRLWRLLYRPYICATEAAGMKVADRVVTVSNGIASLLAQIYALGTLPAVIRNVPTYQEFSMRVPGEQLELLYHGLLNDDRGIESLIVAAGLIKRPFRLVIRGTGNERYLSFLRQLAQSKASSARIEFEPAVPIEEVIAAASRADIGVFMPPVKTPHAKFMLPNKLFEYLMAGLMVIVSSPDEMAGIVRQYNCGIVLADNSPAKLASTIDALTNEQIAEYKSRARLAAQATSWDTEQLKLGALYTELALD